MKNVFAFLLIFLSVLQISAQTPQKMSYQAVIRDANGQLMKNRNIGMQVSVLQGSENGTVVFAERFFPSTNENGLVTVEIGGGLSVNGSFAAIDWKTGPFFIKTETDINGGANYTLSATSQLLSVPYALLAKNVENVPSLKMDDLTDVDATNIQAGQLLKWDGTNWKPANDATTGGPGTTYTPGSGISIDVNNVISNTGDLSTTNEIQQLELAGNQLKLTGANTVTLPTGPTYTAGPGISLANNTITNIGDNDNNSSNELQQLSLSGTVLTLSQNGGSVNLPTSGGGDNWGTQTATTNSPLSGNGTSNNPITLLNNSIGIAHLNQMGAQNGQVLKWNGQNWIPSTDEVGNNQNSITINAGNGISVNPLTGNNFTVTNTSPGNQLNLLSGNGISISGSWPNFTISNSVNNNNFWVSDPTGRIQYNGTGIIVGDNSVNARLDNNQLSFKIASTTLPMTYFGDKIFGSGPLTFTELNSSEMKAGVNQNNFIALNSEGIVKTTTLGSDEFFCGFKDNFNQSIKQLKIKLNGIEVLNGIKIGKASSVTPVPDGTIQFDNGDFMGRVNGQWKSLTTSGLNGSGTTTFIPYFTSSNTLSNSNLSLNSATGTVTLNGGNNGILVVKNNSAVEGRIHVTGDAAFIGSFTNHNTVLTRNGDNLITLEADKFRPSSDNFLALGSSTRRWKEVWAGDGTINTSDRNLKTNIKPSTYGINEIMKLKPSQYFWKNDETSQNKQIGFIAQEVLEVIPEAVVTTESIMDPISKETRIIPVQNLGMRYDMLIPVLTKAIQEQQIVIEELTQKIEQNAALQEELDSRYEKLLNKFTFLEAKIEYLGQDSENSKTNPVAKDK